MEEMTEIEVDYLTIVGLGGDPYSSEIVLRTKCIDTSDEEMYKVKVVFINGPDLDILKEDEDGVLEFHQICPLCKEGELLDFYFLGHEEYEEQFDNIFLYNKLCTHCGMLIGLKWWHNSDIEVKSRQLMGLFYFIKQYKNSGLEQTPEELYNAIVRAHPNIEKAYEYNPKYHSSAFSYLFKVVLKDEGE